MARPGRPGCPKPLILLRPSHQQQPPQRPQRPQRPQPPPPPLPPPSHQQPRPPPLQYSSKPVVPQRPGPATMVGTAPPASGSDPSAIPRPTPPPAVTSAPPGASPSAQPTSYVPTTPAPPPPAHSLDPGPKQGPGSKGPIGGKQPGELKSGVRWDLNAPGGHSQPLQEGGGEPYHQEPRQGPSPGGHGEEKMTLLRRPGEKTYTQRCQLFVGKLPYDVTEDELKRLFAKYGEPRNIFVHQYKGYGLIRLETKALAQLAKAELDDTCVRGSKIQIRFARRNNAFSVRNLSPYVTNELLEEAFSQFGPVESAVVIVDGRGRSTGKGIVEFETLKAKMKAYQRCSQGVFLLTTTPRPVIVEPLEQFNDEDGYPEKLAERNSKYQKARKKPPRFAECGTFEYEYSQRWKFLYEMEKEQREQVEKNINDAKRQLEREIEDAYQANLLRQGLMTQTGEIRGGEELHDQKQRRQEEEQHRREEEIIYQCEMEEMRHQGEESYSQMDYEDPSERDLRTGRGGATNMGAHYGSGGQKCSPVGGGSRSSGLGYEANPGVPPATMSDSTMGNYRCTEPFGQAEGAETLTWGPEKAVCHDGSISGTQTPVETIAGQSTSGGAAQITVCHFHKRKRYRKRKRIPYLPTWTQMEGLIRESRNTIESQGNSVTPATMFMTMLAIVSCQSAAKSLDPSSNSEDIHRFWLKNKEEEDEESEYAPDDPAVLAKAKLGEHSLPEDENI
ncbi:splicing factor, proline- and glutamine-rich-like [Marmota flaviventris]|uniref:splicing factor, proline- and glutamine-rich-like n=1 Tax=Marmota flaviventris TaxID=93162 RepID=UPI003A86EC2C